MRKFLSLGAFLSALVFAAMGMWIPPQGEISGSVLILIAQLLVLCATMLGIKDYTSIINKTLQKS